MACLKRIRPRPICRDLHRHTQWRGRTVTSAFPPRSTSPRARLFIPDGELRAGCVASVGISVTTLANGDRRALRRGQRRRRKHEAAGDCVDASGGSGELVSEPRPAVISDATGTSGDSGVGGASGGVRMGTSPAACGALPGVDGEL